MADRSNGQIAIATAVAIILGAAMAWAGSDGGDRFGSWPVFALCGLLAFAINWIAFVPSALARTERYYDLTGGISYLSVIAVAVLLSDDLDARAVVVAVMVAVWATRLATFLFMRIHKAGSDSRFDDIKNRPARFFMAWTLQGLWVLLTAAAALAVVTGNQREDLGVIGLVGAGVWLVGFVIEIVADHQKSRFKRDPANDGDYVDVGLWAWSRHPNYFGEIVLWTGIAIMAIPVLQGWQWATLVSPFFVAFLLIKVSGIPLLEEKADQRWSGQADYEHYKQSTPVLVPLPPMRRG